MAIRVTIFSVHGSGGYTYSPDKKDDSKTECSMGKPAMMAAVDLQQFREGPVDRKCYIYQSRTHTNKKNFIDKDSNLLDIH